MGKAPLITRTQITKAFMLEVKATVAVDKSAVFTVVRYLYLVEKVLFSVALSADGDFTIKQADYIPDLIEEK